MLISIIVPVYNEQDNLERLNREIFAVLTAEKIDFEIIYVDDGSVDNSFQELKKNSERCGNNIKIIKLIRNFGQTQAMAAGIDYAQGDVAIFMDADLQNDPADISKMMEQLNRGYDVVSGWRRNRNDALFLRKIPSYIANKLISKLTGVKLKDHGCILKAYKRECLKQIRFYGNMHRFIPAYLALKGARIAEVEGNHRPRHKGVSKYNLMRAFEVLLDLCTLKLFWGYSTKPIYVFGGAGVFLIILSLFTALAVIIRKLFYGGIWVSPMLFLFILFFTMGVQFILMGVLAELLIRIYYDKSSLYSVDVVIRPGERYKDKI